VQAQPVAKLAPSEESTLEKELLLLRDAKSALDRGDSAKALSVLDQHEKTYPDGVLAEERGATRVLALCAAGRTQDAKLSARDFLAKYPRSPSAVRVRASCGAP
jgi:outer membrane protein assembly factor BamD (BamD/ComL family)